MKSSFGSKLKQLRENKNLTLLDLGLRVDVSKQSIHRYENNFKTPSTSTLLKISNVLDVHPSHFFNDDILDIKIENINFREEDAISKYHFDINEVKNQCNDYLSSLFELQSLLGENVKFENPLKGIEITNKRDVEKAAKSLRRKWKLGDAAISDVTRVVESNKVSIIELDLVSDFTGLSGIANDDIPFIVVNENFNDISRKRFTILHELAHVVLEFAEFLGNNTVEKFCNHFAGAVLLVDNTLNIELGKNRTTISIGELRAIKEKYGISIQSIIMRAKVTGLISQDTSNVWWESYSEWNKNSQEINQFGLFRSREKSSKFDKLLARGINEKRITWGKAARLKNTKVDILKNELSKLEFIVS